MRLAGGPKSNIHQEPMVLRAVLNGVSVASTFFEAGDQGLRKVSRFCGFPDRSDCVANAIS